MLLRDLRKVYISECEEIEDHGETTKKWRFKLDKLEIRQLATKNNDGIAFLNLQNDINELDRKPTGEIDYSIYKGRTTIDYPIEKGDGISFKDISNTKDFVPEYRVLDKNKIGNTFVYRLEKMQ